MLKKIIHFQFSQWFDSHQWLNSIDFRIFTRNIQLIGFWIRKSVLCDTTLVLHHSSLLCRNLSGLAGTTETTLRHRQTFAWLGRKCLVGAGLLSCLAPTLSRALVLCQTEHWWLVSSQILSVSSCTEMMMVCFDSGKHYNCRENKSHRHAQAAQAKVF